MKVAISSASFAQAIATGHLTQLEWLERCADGIGADGVIFERSHFVRTDPEYIAQIKKVTVDLGLVPLAVADSDLFDPAVDERRRLGTVDIAAGVGALFVISRLPAPGNVPPATFVAVVDAAKTAIRAAKAANVTLLVEPASGTLGDGLAALRHLCKDVDSAWLRYAVPAGIDRGDLGARDRVLLVTLGVTTDPGTLEEINQASRPWIALDGPVDAARVAALHRTAAAIPTGR